MRGDFLDEVRELLYLALPDAPGVERIVEHHGEQLDGPAVARHGDMDRLSHAGVVIGPQRAALRLTHRPAADQADSRHPVFALPVTDKVAVRHPLPACEPPGLVRFAVAPGLD